MKENIKIHLSEYNICYQQPGVLQDQLKDHIQELIINS
jgi:hypothetical protein